jgi:hypothetical protein
MGKSLSELVGVHTICASTQEGQVDGNIKFLRKNVVQWCPLD